MPPFDSCRNSPRSFGKSKSWSNDAKDCMRTMSEIALSRSLAPETVSGNSKKIEPMISGSKIEFTPCVAIALGSRSLYKDVRLNSAPNRVHHTAKLERRRLDRSDAREGVMEAI